MPTSIALSELQSREVPAVRWDVILPEAAPSEQIGLNVGLLGRIARIGGLERISFASPAYAFETQADQTAEPVSTVVGRQADAPSPDDDPLNVQVRDSSQLMPFPSYNHARINLDVRAIGTAIAEKSDQTANNPRVWSRALNHHIKEGLGKAITQNLVSADGVKTWAALSTLFVTLDSVGHASALQRFEDVVLPLGSIMPIIYGFAAAGTGTDFKDIRMSFVPGVHLDRLAASKGALAMSRLVRPLKG